MAVALDVNMNAGNGVGGLDQNATGVTTITTSTGITVGANATLLVVTFTWGSGASVDPTSRTCTWDGVSMTEGPTVGASSGVQRARASIFTLVNPHSGAKALTGNWTGSCDAYMSATSFKGTDTVTGIKVSDSITATATTTITPTSDANGATVACFSGASGSIPTTNFNQIYAEAPFNQGGGASYQLAGASNAHTFTGAGSTVEALAAVHIITVSGVIPSTGAYQQEQSSTDRYQLEDGSGVYLIEPWGQTGIFLPPFIQGDLTGIGTPGRFFKDRLN